MVTNSKWIRFEQLESKTKTSVYNVIAKEGDTKLGQIKWYAPWRKYSFFPAPNTLFETQCLKDIILFINQCMEDRKPKLSLSEMLMQSLGI